MSCTGRMTWDELLRMLRDRFGVDPFDWAFVCPNCGDVATGRDFMEALAENPRRRARGGTVEVEVRVSDLLGIECIGRTLGALKRGQTWTGRGCDWAAYGLIRGPLTIERPDGTLIHGFMPAEAP